MSEQIPGKKDQLSHSEKAKLLEEAIDSAIKNPASEPIVQRKVIAHLERFRAGEHQADLLERRGAGEDISTEEIEEGRGAVFAAEYYAEQLDPEGEYLPPRP